MNVNFMIVKTIRFFGCFEDYECFLEILKVRGKGKGSSCFIYLHLPMTEGIIPPTYRDMHFPASL